MNTFCHFHVYYYDNHYSAGLYTDKIMSYFFGKGYRVVTIYMKMSQNNPLPIPFDLAPIPLHPSQ